MSRGKEAWRDSMTANYMSQEYSIMDVVASLVGWEKSQPGPCGLGNQLLSLGSTRELIGF